MNRNLGSGVFLLLALIVCLAIGAHSVQADSSVLVDNLQPSYTAPGGGGVYSAYYGPPGSFPYSPVSPGTTALYDGREAGIIKAGLTIDPTDLVYEDEGIFAFKPTVTINALAAGALTYDVDKQEGTNPVWMTIEIDTGVLNDRDDNTTYQHVPTTNPAGWHTVDAAAGLWQKWNDGDGDVTGNPLISLGSVATAHTGLNVVRAYLRLGMGDSYHGTGSGTVAWVDKATIGGVTYDFVVPTYWYVAKTGLDTNEGTAASPFLTIQKAVNSAIGGDTIHVAPGTYAENVTVNKALTIDGAGDGSNPTVDTIMEGTGLGANGIFVASNVTDVTITDMRIQNYSLAAGAGIWANGQNDRFTVQHVSVINNGVAGNNGGGVYMNGPVDTVLIDDVVAQNNRSRGIVIWNGFKQNITFTNNDVQNNNCCGIELQDGTASGVTMTGNTVSNNTDSGMAAIGLTSGAGPNLIANNTLASNGRFGIEIKMPNGTGLDSGDGSIVVQNNSVSLTTAPADLRDYAGIGVMRRAYLVGAGYADIPTGVVVRNNTVSGYRQTNVGSFSTGFGIAVEGSNMVTANNTLTNNDVGVQMQAGHLPYTPNAGPDGDQSNVADTYFGRGNSPLACGEVTGNTYSGNTVNYREVGPIGGPYGLTIPAGATTAQQQAIIGCAAGKTVTYAGNPAAGGVVVNTNGVKINLNGATVGHGSPAYTINADNVTVTGGVLDGAGDPSPAVLVNAGADNFTLENVEVRNWAQGVEVAGSVNSLKIVGNWFHDNTGNGVLVDSTVALGGVVTIEGNLFKFNGGNGIQNDGATANLPAEYNSWGDFAGPAAGDGVGGSVDATPFSFAELFVDVTPDTLATTRTVNEGDTPVNVAVKVDAAGLYAAQYKLTYDSSLLTLNSVSDGSFKGTGTCVTNTATPGVVTVYCSRRGPDADANGMAQTISTLHFTANTGMVGDGPWPGVFDLSVLPADLSAGARGGIKVYVNNGGFGAPSALPGHTITDANDGEIIINGLANYTGYVDLQGRSNDSGAAVEVYNQATKAGATELANASSAAGGAYTTVYIVPNQLVIGTTYYLFADRALYLPTTQMAVGYYTPVVPLDWTHSKPLATRPLTSLTKVVLLGGDATNEDVVNIGDATCIGSNYGGAAAACGGGNPPGNNADVTGDGVVNILDLVLMGGNFDLTSSPWTP